MIKQVAGHGLLFFFVFLVLPIRSLSFSGHVHASPHLPNFRRVLIGHDSDKYAVIFDAGSTGSRVHVFRFNENQDLLPIGNEIDVNLKVKPGLSSYAGNAEAAANSLRPLLEKAESVVPIELQPDTPARLGATAGLRLLKGDEAEKILDAVRNLFKNESNLKYKHDWVSILDGTQEGTYMWVTVNYLLNTLGRNYSGTVATIDLGGASIQMAYAISDENAIRAPQEDVSANQTYVLRKSFRGTDYNLYVHSYLSYGRQAARAEIFKAAQNSTNPCILEGYDGTYTYGGVVYRVSAPPTGTNMKKCVELTRKALKLDAPCKYDKCTFDGVWNGGGGDGLDNLYLSSSFYWTAHDDGLIKPNATVGRIRIRAYKNAAKVACAANVDNILSIFPNVEKDNIPYVCMDLVYLYTLLVDGFDLDPSKKVTVVKELTYKNSNVETAWPLGCAIDVMSSLTTTPSIADV